MIYNIVKISWIACVMLLCQNNCGWGSGGSLVSSGAFGRCYVEETGYRQLVNLKESGDILSAIPQNSPIRLIVLYAPGLKKGHLIIRDLELSNKEKSILISVPSNIQSHIQRATIYLTSASNHDLLYQQDERRAWKLLEPISLIVSSGLLSDQDVSDGICAYPVSQLGNLYLLSQPKNTSIDTVSSPSDLKTGLTPMGSIRTGMFPLICAGILYIFISTLAYIIHRMELKGINLG